MNLDIEVAQNGYICRTERETLVFESDRELLQHIHRAVGPLRGTGGRVTIDYYDRDSKSLRECIEICSKDLVRLRRIRPANWQGCGLWLAPVYDREDGLLVGFAFEIDKCEDYNGGSGPWVIEDYDPKDYHCPVE